MQEDLSKELMLKELKNRYPNLMVDRIPFIKDKDGVIVNQDDATELNRLQKKLIYGLNPSKKPIILGWLPNRIGKSFGICINLMLLILDDHPRLDHRGIKGDYLLMTNSKLLKTEYPKVFFSNPGLLGQYNEYTETFEDESGKAMHKNCHTIINSRGESHVLRVSKDADGMLEFIENLTTGKRIRFFSYTQNYQVIAGQSFLSAFLDEVGDDTKTDKAKGANALTVEKFQELLVRVGSQQALKDNFIVMLLFSLTLNNMWLEDLVELAKEGKIIVPEINPDEQCIEVLQGFTAKDNPYYNPRTFNLALGISKFLGDKAQRDMERRLLDTSMDDTTLVFPKGKRPIPITSAETDKYIQKWTTSKNEWTFVVSIDPGMSDKMGVLFALIHPVEGIVVCREIYKSRVPVEQACQMILNIEEKVFGETPKHRWFDKHTIFKTSQENVLAKASYWAKHLGKYPEKAYQPDRSYDRMFEIIGKGLVKFNETHCEGLEYELRKHKNDPRTGLPKEADANHLIDCFTGDSLVETIGGIKRIDEITDKDFVLTSKGYRPVKWAGISNKRKGYRCYNISTDKGNFILKCSEDHLIKGEGKWQEIKTLKEGDQIFLSKTFKEKDITYTQMRNISQKELKGFIELFGNTIMDQSRRISMFIIKIVIQLITILEILNLYLEKITWRSILEKGIKTIQSLPSLIWRKIKISVESGINQSKVSSGIVSTEKTHSLYLKKYLNYSLKGLVYFVIRNFSLLHFIVNSVISDVKKDIDTLYQRITLLKHVKNVENLTHNMTSTNPHFVQLHVLSVTEQEGEKECELYDIQVLGTNHEFVVNGVLVHNCARWLCNYYYDKHYKPYQKSDGAVTLSDLDPKLREYQMMRNYAIKKLSQTSNEEAGKIFGYKIYDPYKRFK